MVIKTGACRAEGNFKHSFKILRILTTKILRILTTQHNKESNIQNFKNSYNE